MKKKTTQTFHRKHYPSIMPVTKLPPPNFPGSALWNWFWNVLGFSPSSASPCQEQEALQRQKVCFRWKRLVLVLELKAAGHSSRSGPGSSIPPTPFPPPDPASQLSRATTGSHASSRLHFSFIASELAGLFLRLISFCFQCVFFSPSASIYPTR